MTEQTNSWEEIQRMDSRFAVLWSEIEKLLPKTIEREALGDAKIARAVQLAFIQVLPVIISQEKEKMIDEIKKLKFGDDKNVCYCSGKGKHSYCERSGDRMIDKIINLLQNK